MNLTKLRLNPVKLTLISKIFQKNGGDASRRRGGGIFFPNPQGWGIFKIFPARGGVPPTPLFPTPALHPNTTLMIEIIQQPLC